MDKVEFYEYLSKDVLKSIVRENTTPCYLYFMKIIEKKLCDLKNCLPPQFKIHYAIKANPNKEIVRRMGELGVGADVASRGELKIALDSGISEDRIELTGPGKTSEEIEYAIKRDICSINTESISELKKIVKICKSINKTAKVGVRINPNAERFDAGLRMSGDSQFGLQEPFLKKALEFIRSNSKVLQFSGIHIHSGSQMLSEDLIINHFRDILDLALRINTYHILKIRKINFGGGWGINYFPNQKRLDLIRLKEGFKKIFKDPKYKNLLEGTKLTVEPGRFLVGECGLYATRVLYCKKGIKKNFAVVDGGMHQHYLLAGGMGQVIRRNFEMDVFYEKDRKSIKLKKYDIVGCLCTPQDILAVNLEWDREIKEGDTILFFNSGAYGFTASPVYFLSHTLPSEIIVT